LLKLATTRAGHAAVGGGGNRYREGRRGQLGLDVGARPGDQWVKVGLHQHVIGVGRLQNR